VKVTMHLKCETPHKYRYEEAHGNDKLGGLYIDKHSFEGKPAPKTILVTVQSVDDG
jgi:hypothetical protein